MKKLLKVLALLLALYLIASVAASLFVTLCDNPRLTGPVVRNRYGLLLMELCPEDSTFVIWSPFNNACDVFLLVVDWENPQELRVVSDGFYYFGHW